MAVEHRCGWDEDIGLRVYGVGGNGRPVGEGNETNGRAPRKATGMVDSPLVNSRFGLTLIGNPVFHGCRGQGKGGICSDHPMNEV